MVNVIGILLLVFSVSFLLILRKRGIILYIPTQKVNGKVINIVTRHRISMEPQRGVNSMRHQMDINEDFAIVEIYNENSKYIAESMFPILPFEIEVGDDVTVYYRKNKRKVYIKKCK